MSQRKIKNEQPVKKAGLSTKEKTIYISIISVLFIAVIGVLVWLDLRPTPPKPEPTMRFEELTHITLNQYKVIINQLEKNDLKDEEYDDFDKIDLAHNVYVFIYNGEYDESETTQRLEALVTEVGKKEDNSFTFLVLNYYLHQGITDLVKNTSLPVDPVLVHIEGETVKEDGIQTNYLSIVSVLNRL